MQQERCNPFSYSGMGMNIAAPLNACQLFHYGFSYSNCLPRILSETHFSIKRVMPMGSISSTNPVYLRSEKLNINA
jgi:hypothetical protein